MITLNDVWRIYQVGESPVVALQGVNLQIRDGEFLAIVGPSGSGKSTLLQIIGLLDRPSHGTVELDGRDLGGLSDAERTRLRLYTLGFVFQRFHLLHELTALENVALPMEAAGVPVEQRYQRAAELLRRMGLGERLAFRPAQLSGGQRQRVAIARALANSARLVLADEPTGELHSEDRQRVVALFRELQRAGHTILVVTHSLEVAQAADRLVEIRDGRIQEVAA
jgi:ABC-type lipoprotein export system ATPase subunit